MSSSPAIRVEGVSKVYRMYARPQDKLLQALSNRLLAPYSSKPPRKYFTEHWALQNVSFTVERGECFGIVGRNGSGKSTLLQIVAGTLPATAGSLVVSGRTAALLELGSGFNPEFTGRENVFLNGTILGCTQDEIEDRFDEIVDFSEIGEFIDQPVKTYSSGMMVRLAFSVAAHLDPEILIVDEALSVGDVGFQHKCMARFDRIKAKGTTILFVTHDTGAVEAHCERALFLKDGHTAAIGPASEVVYRYMQHALHKKSEPIHVNPAASAPPLASLSPEALSQEVLPPLNAVNASYRWGTNEISIQGWNILDATDRPKDQFRFGDMARIVMLIEARTDIERCFPGFVFRDRNGYHLTGITNRTCKQEIEGLQAGARVLLRFDVELRYRADNYSILLNICHDEFGSAFFDVCENIGNFTVVDEPRETPPWGYGRVYLPTKLVVRHIGP